MFFIKKEYIIKEKDRYLHIKKFVSLYIKEYDNLLNEIYEHGKDPNLPILRDTVDHKLKDKIEFFDRGMTSDLHYSLHDYITWGIKIPLKIDEFLDNNHGCYQYSGKYVEYQQGDCSCDPVWSFLLDNRFTTVKDFMGVILLIDEETLRDTHDKYIEFVKNIATKYFSKYVYFVDQMYSIGGKDWDKVYKMLECLYNKEEFKFSTIPVFSKVFFDELFQFINSIEIKKFKLKTRKESSPDYISYLSKLKESEELRKKQEKERKEKQKEEKKKQEEQERRYEEQEKWNDEFYERIEDLYESYGLKKKKGIKSIREGLNSKVVPLDDIYDFFDEYATEIDVSKQIEISQNIMLYFKRKVNFLQTQTINTNTKSNNNTEDTAKKYLETKDIIFDRTRKELEGKEKLIKALEKIIKGFSSKIRIPKKIL